MTDPLSPQYTPVKLLHTSRQAIPRREEETKTEKVAPSC